MRQSRACRAGPDDNVVRLGLRACLRDGPLIALAALGLPVDSLGALLLIASWRLCVLDIQGDLRHACQVHIVSPLVCRVSPFLFSLSASVGPR